MSILCVLGMIDRYLKPLNPQTFFTTLSLKHVTSMLRSSGGNLTAYVHLCPVVCNCRCHHRRQSKLVHSRTRCTSCRTPPFYQRIVQRTATIADVRLVSV
ncbi:hypothetical protein HanPI659440_Chr09g0320331 [Helianthus annuus]|nr:hypothetical protein HanPI659440_Chr09g0320331 [Helianthus annuus]